MSDNRGFTRSSGHSRLVLAEARRTVEEFLSLLDHPGDLGELLPEAMDRLGELAEFVIGPLIDAMDAVEGGRSVMAAWMLLLCESRSPGFVDDAPVLRRADELLRRTLCSKDPEESLRPIILLSHYKPPACLLDTLISLVRSPDERVRIGAAATVFKWKPESKRALKVLICALRSGDPAFIGASVPPLAGLTEHRAEAIDALTGAIAAAEGIHLMGLLFAARQVGSPPASLLDAIAGVVGNPGLPPGHRAYAAVTVAIMCPEGDKTRSAPLIELLALPDPVLIRGGADGLSRLRSIPAEGALALGNHLKHGNAEQQEAAAFGLMLLRGSAAPATDALLSRIGAETDLDRVFLVCRSLASIGASAIPPMIERARERNILVASTVATAFQYLAPDSIRAVAAILESEDDERVEPIRKPRNR